MKTNETNEFKFNEETLKRIPNSLGYFISNTGNVYRRKYITEPFKQLKKTINSVGYECITIYYGGDVKVVKKYWQVHRLLFTIFKEEIPFRLVINHKDSNQLNNNIDNLEMVTSKQNKDHGNLKRGFTPYHTILEKDGLKTVCKTHKEVQELLGLELRVHVITAIRQTEYNGYKITKEYMEDYKKC